MPDDNGVRDLLTFIRDDLKSFRVEMNDRLDKLVTQASFNDERRRVDGLIAALGQDLVEERQARQEADIVTRMDRDKALEKLEKKSANTGLWIRWSIALLIGIPAAILTLAAIFR